MTQWATSTLGDWAPGIMLLVFLTAAAEEVATLAALPGGVRGVRPVAELLGALIGVHLTYWLLAALAAGV